MNIELIKKYKAEFNHILNGGKLLGRLSKTTKWQSLRIEVFESKDNNWNIIIDDEYVEFRRALAEGNTIQCNQSGYWEDLNHIPLFNQNISNYRIKPEEPQFLNSKPSWFKD